MRFRISVAVLLTLPFCKLALAQPARPLITAVANAASYQKGTVSPGEMVVLFGTLLGPTQLTHLQLDTSGKLSTNIGSVQVTFGGIAAPLIYVSAAQTCVMVPYEVVGSSSTPIVVSYEGMTSQPYTAAVARTAPGIFSANASGQGLAAASNADGTVNGATNPAVPGSYVTFYVTGEGPLSVPGTDGSIATAADQVGSQVAVTIGGVQAQVMYAGAAPGNTNGFAQVNAVIPATLQSGGQLPLVVWVGTAASQSALTVSVSGPTGPVTLAAPTNLQASLASSTTANLTWVNNAASATAIRVEVSTAGGAFQDVGAANTLTSTSLANLQSATAYTFRVRAQSGVTYSPYSITATLTTSTPAKPSLTVFLVHGTAESSADSAKLGQTLTDPVFGIGVAATIDWGFSWPCAKDSIPQCNSSCTIPQGAMTLAQYIIGKTPPGGRFVLIGHSLGGLLSRDMLLNNWSEVTSTRTFAGLITLGTPNVGYPFVEGLDDSATANLIGVTLCPTLGQEMASDYRTLQSQNQVIESAYLTDLNQRWGSTSLSTQSVSWLAASGTFCTDPIRSTVNPVGCPDSNPVSDGVVCDQSARFRLSVARNVPTVLWSSNLYAHTSSTIGTRYASGFTILCTTQSALNSYIPLYDPPASSVLVAAIRSFVDGL